MRVRIIKTAADREIFNAWEDALKAQEGDECSICGNPLDEDGEKARHAHLSCIERNRIPSLWDVTN